jgi:hypothetical protein
MICSLICSLMTGAAITLGVCREALLQKWSMC